MLEFCNQCCELAKFIETKEYTNIIEYDKEYQHLKYLYENQKKKYKMYQQALNSNIELHKLILCATCKKLMTKSHIEVHKLKCTSD